MPIYEYTCEKCGTRIDVLQKMDAAAPGQCGSCGAEGTMARQVSRTSFVLKGGGWYSDLYGSSKKDGSTSPSPSSTSTGSTTPAAPAAATDSTKKDSSGSGNTGGSSPPASGGTPSSSGGTGGTSASPG
ncbi:MAG: putative regulatory protein, FmdB family [Myxococcaceae bacterium]|nr:putative regulatory protein, FmdB family [Myxococcaceae bacterium]